MDTTTPEHTSGPAAGEPASFERQFSSAHPDTNHPLDGRIDLAARQAIGGACRALFMHWLREVMRDTYVDRYHHRPHSRLDYKTPYEVKETWEDLQNIAA